MKATNSILLLLLLTSFICAGCKSGEQGSENPVEEVVEKTEEMHEEMEGDVNKAAPPEIAAELWDLISIENYKEHWKMEPGKAAFSDAGDGKLVTTYLNDIAYEAVEKGEEMPPGSIVVSDNFNLEKQLESVSAKAYIPGFDNGKEGWFGVTYDPGGKPISYE